MQDQLWLLFNYIRIGYLTINDEVMYIVQPYLQEELKITREHEEDDVEEEYQMFIRDQRIRERQRMSTTVRPGGPGKLSTPRSHPCLNLNSY